MGDRLGQQLGNYRLVKLLGTGGFAEVYLGQHVHLASKQAAIKILHLLDVDARKFQEEAETTEQLVHLHIVRLLDFAIEQGTPFLVLDYAPGGSLRTRHPKGSILPLASVEAYLQELAPALQYAHDQHILHRDIKPDNMLIGRQGELLLSDFGIAVLTQTGRTSMSGAYGIGGTPYYMAPETYRGRPVQASDQYALAVVVYEWLCGSVPFSQGNFIQLGYQHTHEPVPPLREKNPAISPHVEAAVMKALAKEPKDRFASVQTFAQAFEQACIQARQAEQARLQAEAQERARQAEEERLREVKEAREKARKERLRRAEEAREKAREEQARQAEAEQARLAVEGRMPSSGERASPMPSQPFSPTGSLPSRPILTPPKSLRSLAVFVVLILLIVFGIYGVTTGNWPWNAFHGPSNPNSPGAGTQTNTTLTTTANSTSTTPANTNIPGHTWHAQHSGTTEWLDAVAWSGSQFVAVGQSGTILTSPDGSTWMAQHSGTSQYLRGIAWSGSQFVVVGDSGTILTSPDGRTWTAQHSRTTDLLNAVYLNAVAWSGSQFVVVGDSGTILTSPDGRTWTAQHITTRLFNAVACSGSQCVVVSTSGTILTSPDGRTWTVQHSGTTEWLDAVAWSGSQFVAVGQGGTILTSPDGSTWMAQHSGITDTLHAVACSGSQCVVVAEGSSLYEATILTSPDGRTWTAQHVTATLLNAVACSGSQCVTVGGGTFAESTILTSP